MKYAEKFNFNEAKWDQFRAFHTGDAYRTPFVRFSTGELITTWAARRPDRRAKYP
jgi:hypothetical protein